MKERAGVGRVALLVPVMVLLVSLIAVSLFFVLRRQGEAAPPSTNVSGSIFANTTWTKVNSPYIVTGNVILFPGYSLTVEPGVNVQFNAGTGLEIRGDLVAVGGTGTDVIVFTTASTGSLTKGMWSGIQVRNQLGGKASLRHVKVLYAGTAVSVECCGGGGPVNIADSEFNTNQVALGGYAGWTMFVERTKFLNNTSAVTSADKAISYSEFKNNQFGLNATERVSVCASTFTQNGVALYGGRGEVKYSEISQNGTGITPFFEGFTLRNNTITANGTGSGVVLPQAVVEFNNIFGNTPYNMRNSVAANQDVRNNWWGTTDTNAIDAGIFDGFDNSALGLISYQPILPQAVDITPPAGACPTPTSTTGTIIIVKDAIPNDPQDFAFTSSFFPGTVLLDDDADLTLPNTATFTNLQPGTYTVTETALPGQGVPGQQEWYLLKDSVQGSVCVYPGGSTTTFGSTATINLAAGATVTCTFPNSKAGRVIVDKVTIPAGDPQVFQFNSAWGNFSLTDAGTGNNSGFLSPIAPGGYLLNETLPAGWTLTSIVCADPDGGTTVGPTPANPTLPATSAIIDLDPGETITCTFTNTKQSTGTGTLTIVKDAQPDDAQDFGFHAFGPNSACCLPFSLDDDNNATLSNTKTYSNLAAGSYSFSEDLLAGWDLTSIACNPSTGTTVDLVSRAVTVNVTGGATVTCTFTNRKVIVPPPAELLVYSVKFVCGTVRPRSPKPSLPAIGDPGAVVPGVYRTSVNVHNFREVPATFQKKVAVANPQGEPRGNVSEKVTEKLENNQALAVDCRNIVKLLAIPVPPFLEGFVVIESLVELEVTAVYTMEELLEQGVSIHVMEKAPHLVPCTRPRDITLISGNDSNQDNRDDDDEFLDAAGNWQKAYIVAPVVSYNVIPGTRWINLNPNNSGPANTTTRYRTTFALPPPSLCFPNPRLTVDIHADNVATIRLNGVQIGAQQNAEIQANFQDPPESFTTTTGFQAGVNTLEFDIHNFSGPTGFDYKAIVTFLP